MDAITIKRLSEVHPLLRQKIEAVIATMEASGIAVRVTQGLRTVAEQDALYALGRTILKTPAGLLQHKVTNAKGGYSSHNFGLAVDCAPELIPGGVYDPDWNSEDDHYAAMQQAARAQGLICGADWRTMPDPPHFQLAGAPVTPNDKMRQVLFDSGLPAVWTRVVA